MAKKDTTQPDPMAVAMPDIGEPASEAKSDDNPKSSEELLVALSAQVATLTGQVAEGAKRETHMATMVEQALGGTGPVAPMAPAVVPIAAADPLPDPVDDKEGFQKALLGAIGTAVRDAVGQSATATNAATAHQGRYEKLWSDFQGVHEEEAKYPGLVKSIGTEKVQELQARGLDADKVIFGNPKGFMAEVAEEVASQVKAIRGDGDGGKGNGADKNPTPGALPADDRTGGISGGSGGPAVPADTTAKEKPEAFTNEVKAMQKGAGYL